jgi:NADPH-dependent 2,4-dienoyl-CoA reductase/sulfur reductase-like enzyme
MKKIYAIVGGVAGGATAAARVRRLDESSEIIVFERGDYISYANCGLPYYIGETIKDWDNLFVQTEESFEARFNVDVRIRNEVLSIDREKKEIQVKDLLKNEVYTIKNDKLLLSPGAEPFKPNIPSIDDSRIFTLRNPEDTKKNKRLYNIKKC